MDRLEKFPSILEEKQIKRLFSFRPHYSQPTLDPLRRLCDAGRIIVKPLYITCAHAVPLNSKMLGLMNADCLVVFFFFQFAHLIWFKVTTSQMWEAKVKIIRLSRKKAQIEASSAFAVPPTAPLLYYRVIKHSFLSQASSLITQ